MTTSITPPSEFKTRMDGKVERMKDTFVPTLKPYAYEESPLLAHQGYVTRYPGKIEVAELHNTAVEATKYPGRYVNSQGVAIK